VNESADMPESDPASPAALRYLRVGALLLVVG